jgi:hypothetical protein
MLLREGKKIGRVEACHCCFTTRCCLKIAEVYLVLCLLLKKRSYVDSMF